MEGKGRKLKMPYHMLKLSSVKWGKKAKKMCFLSQFGLKIYCTVQNESSGGSHFRSRRRGGKEEKVDVGRQGC